MIFKKRVLPEIGMIKIRKKFLILPRFMDDRWVWLGVHTLTYKYVSRIVYIDAGTFDREGVWELINIT